MTKTRLQDLLKASANLLAGGDIDTLSMRALGDRVGIKQSVIYHYFQSKDDLLSKTFQYCLQKLNDSLASLPANIQTVQDMLRQRIEYQFDNAELMMASVKYLMSNPAQPEPQQQDGSKTPPELYGHIQQVLERGVREGVFVIEDIAAETKTITHAINGFIMEFYPQMPTDQQRTELINQIHGFILRAITLRGQEAKQ